MEQYLTFISDHPILTGAWLVLFFALVYNFFQARFSAFSRVNTQQLTHLVNREDAIVVDTRSNDDYKKGHIAGAKNVTQHQIDSDQTGSLEKYKQTPIIVVCATGLTATKGANKLVQSGFEHVSVLDGGMNSWQSGSLPVVKG